MKICPSSRRAPHNESGMITVIFIALLGIMMVLILAESRSLIRLPQEVKWVERQQIRRLNESPAPQTNNVAARPRILLPPPN